MNYLVNIEDIEQALTDLGGEATVKSIQDRIFAYHCGNTIPSNYQSERSFRQTIQRKVEDYCRQARGFEKRKKEEKFIRVERGFYALANSYQPSGNRLADQIRLVPSSSKSTASPNRAKKKQAAYKVKLSSMREWLTRVAQLGQPVTYGEVIIAFKLDRFSLVHALTELGRQSKLMSEPILSAMVVNKKTGRCGPGFDAEFGVDDIAERDRLHKFWTGKTVEASVLLPMVDSEERMARFVSKEARPKQAAFRRRVFEACDGQCVISGCDLVEALDAAHKKGRDWRKHNGANDGYVLRKDLHALYDNGLLTIEFDGSITLHASAMPQYGQYGGKKVSV